MSDDVKALIAEAREYGTKGVRWNDGFQYLVSAADIAKTGDLLLELADALEASVQAPAVDQTMFVHLVESWQKMPFDSGDLFHMMEGAGILQDAREVEARGLEKAVDSGHFPLWVAALLATRAQQVRKSTPEVPNEGNTNG